MAIPLIPWEMHSFPKPLQSELNRRSINRGLNIIEGYSYDWGDDGNWESYRGPMAAWVRLCSNGFGFEENNKPGFILYGGKDFYSTYGFSHGGETFGTNQSIIGYTPSGVPHIVENDLLSSEYPIHVPVPEIEKISATIQKEIMRRVTVDWVCFSLKQLEYMTPYFLVPGISAIIEWGWNHFNVESLLNLEDEDQLSKYYINPYSLYTENVLKSKGNYEVLFGDVTNFEWSIEGNLIRCRTEITSKDRLWAGLIPNASIVESEMASDDNSQFKNNSVVEDSLNSFVSQYIDKFKIFVSKDDIKDEDIPDELKNFVLFLKEKHKNNYKEYLYGIFMGGNRGAEKLPINTRSSTVQRSYGSWAPPMNTPGESKGSDALYANSRDDFDVKAPGKQVWMNLGLIVEIINYGCYNLKSLKNNERFRVDVDDCVITAHPNLISSDGTKLLIPNYQAPKYFSGLFGNSISDQDEYSKKMEASDITKEVNEYSHPYDKRLRRICLGLKSMVSRDDLNRIINSNRQGNRHVDKKRSFSFPLSYDYEDDSDGEDTRKYVKNYSGFFKDLYLHVDAFKSAVLKSSTYVEIYENIFKAINESSGDFWQFELVSSVGRNRDLKNNEMATMKVVDNGLTQYTSNFVKDIYTFEYYGSDSVLKSISFRPTLSNAQAIRTIYAQTNNDTLRYNLSEINALLDYKFEDRLRKKSETNSKPSKLQTVDKPKSSFKVTMSKLQSIKPIDTAFQMTEERDGKIVTYRLCIPVGYSELLFMLLDDGDKEYNPRYTGIMPRIEAEFTIQGLSGIRTFSVFRVRGLPEPYSEENILFRTINVTDTVQNGNWITVIKAGIIPLRGYLKHSLSITGTEIK